MSSIIVGRTRARSQAIQVLFQAEVQGVDVFDLLRSGDYALDDLFAWIHRILGE